MSIVHVNIEIDAPLKRVWETIMNPDRFQDWVTIHRSVRNVSESPVREGTTMDQVMHMRGVTFHVHWTLVAVRPPYHAEWEGRGPAYSRARILYDLSGSGDGPTTFEYTNDFMPPGGRVGNAASRMIVGTASDREAHNSLARLKVLLERA
jgi:uncharacterized protein YndB with AHSA1/START domain